MTTCTGIPMPTEINSAPSVGSSRALLHLLHLTSPSLPIGGFAYSQGLEYAIDSGWITTDSELQQWLQGVLGEGMARLELPLLLRFAEAYRQKDEGAVNYWNHWLLANRETKELLFEDQQLGLALRRLLVSLAVIETDDRLPAEPSYCSQFARAAGHYGVSDSEMLTGFAWAWLENQIAVACKTLPLGQTAAQQLMMRLLPVIDQAVATAQRLPDDRLGATLPGVALASSLHETQYSRLFRS
ncbi:urease accessory protein UreF [Motiliproteus sp. SC1-56]|uniref:urease accessory protein UreF n=1 Tax=Motiliproteus sp. SC1-56 TaxID=2799565 RepID=UPI001F5CCFF6|nr:urease accessory UreF family protein [Motiliproteus sp. SC1-56]